MQYSLETKNTQISQLKTQLSDIRASNKKLKDEKTQYEQIILDLKDNKHTAQQEIDYLLQQNNQLTQQLNKEQSVITQLEQQRIKYDTINQDIQNENNTRKTNIKQLDSTILYYEQQLSDSNDTIKRMHQIIKDLENQIEELRNAIEQHTHPSKQEQRIKYDNDHVYTQLQDTLAHKEQQIAQHIQQLDALTEEKAKLFEDNTAMYNDIDQLKAHIYTLTEQNKKLNNKLMMIEEQEHKVQRHIAQRNKLTSALNDNKAYVDITLKNKMIPRSHLNNLDTSQEFSD